FPYPQLSWCCPSVLVRASVPPRTLGPPIRKTIESLDGEIPIYELRTFDEALSLAVSRPRFYWLLLSAFAVIALSLTALGLYGVLAYAVLRRTREIGIRIALGAGRNRILLMVLRRAFGFVAWGMSLGLMGAWGSGQALIKLLYGMSP